MEWVRKSRLTPPMPCLTVYQMMTTNGSAASRKASRTSVVKSRSTACRRPSTPKLSAVWAAT